MLKDCLEVFRKEYDKYGDSLILEGYKLAEGTYILVKKDLSIEVLEVKKKEINGSEELYKYITERDYLSKYLDSNKALNTEVLLDEKNKIGKKVVHSNNYLTFFIKKETLHLNKINKDVILKYYETIDESYKIDNKIRLGEIKEWMLENFMSLQYPESEGKEYLKIFFEEDLDIYKIESDKYIKSKVYNNNKYNVNVNGATYGLPNNNMGLNDKKPFLENRTRKNTLPYLIDEEEVLMQKKFFDYLTRKYEQGNRCIYIDDKISAYPAGGRPDWCFTGYYLRLSKNLEVEIVDMDILVNMRSRIPKFIIEKPIKLDFESKYYADFLSLDETEDIADIENVINEVFFNNFLKTSYFLKFSEIKLSDPVLKKILYDYRDSLYSYFYKGNPNYLKKSFSKFSLEIIKNTLINNPIYIDKAVEQYNLRYSLCKYLNGGIGILTNISDIRDELRAKVNDFSENINEIKSDEEYYYAIGQLSRYFITLSKSKNKIYEPINVLLRSNNNTRIRKELLNLFKRYNYAISLNNRRFSTLYYMILDYVPDSKVNHEVIMVGYLNPNLIYEKKETVKDEAK